VEKRYQVFVSSTYRDLELERQEVMHALLELDCIPSGMELFGAADESQWEVIKGVIDECDYYILILAGRYGSIGPDGLSYTEMEYHYATSIGKPTIAFLHDDIGSIVSDKSEPTPEGREKLATLRKLAQQKTCTVWRTPGDLGGAVSRSLVRLIKRKPAVGWVRGDQLSSREAAEELLALRLQVEDLKSELERVRISPPKGAEKFASGEDLVELTFSFQVHKIDRFDFQTMESSYIVSWDEIFSCIAPIMMHEASEEQMSNYLNRLTFDENIEELRAIPEYANAELQAFKLEEREFHTIKIQLRALGLITPSVIGRAERIKPGWWSLTAYGDEVMTRLLALPRYKEPEPIPVENSKEPAGDSAVSIV